MKQTKNLIVFTVTTLFFTACQKDTRLSQNSPDESAEVNTKSHYNENAGSGDGQPAGHVYTLSNQVSGNKVMDFRRADDGSLTFVAAYETGGNGTGTGLGNQGAIILADKNEIILAVNAGSNSISSFKVKNNGLRLLSTVHSGGERPVSITQHDEVVFVLNAGGNGNISGFRLNGAGKLIPVSNSTKPLSSTNAGAAQISFVRDGRTIAITEKATNTITTYTVNEWGIPGMMHTITSANPTPFGFAVGDNGNIFVSEAAGGAAGASTVSSYRINNDGSISLINGPVATTQSAACWVVLTHNGKFAYTTNTASNTLSTFNVNPIAGNISLRSPVSATTGIGPIDAALNNNSKYLYILNSGSHSISVFAVAGDGGLNSAQTVLGLPIGANGLAAE